MTTDEKNKILELKEIGWGVRKIAREIKRDPMTVFRFLEDLDPNIESFSVCPACECEIIRYKRIGRKRIYCSEQCRHSKKIHKSEERVCLNCGKRFITWKYKPGKYCCHSCYVEHRYGRRLQDKSS